MLPEHLIALDRALAAANREYRERMDRPVDKCGTCGVVVIEGLYTEAGHDEHGQPYRLKRCPDCRQRERAAAMAKGAV